MVHEVSAMVYIGGRRRWFTRYAAEKAEARAVIRKRCECCRGDAVTPPETCHYHAMDPAKFNRLVHLFVVMFVRRAASEV